MQKISLNLSCKIFEGLFTMIAKLVFLIMFSEHVYALEIVEAKLVDLRQEDGEVYVELNIINNSGKDIYQRACKLSY